MPDRRGDGNPTRFESEKAPRTRSPPCYARIPGRLLSSAAGRIATADPTCALRRKEAWPAGGLDACSRPGARVAAGDVRRLGSANGRSPGRIPEGLWRRVRDRSRAEQRAVDEARAELALAGVARRRGQLQPALEQTEEAGERLRKLGAWEPAARADINAALRIDPATGTPARRRYGPS